MSDDDIVQGDISALAEGHGLSAPEYDRILALLGRAPSLTELGIFSAMWNEHCSYKSSKKWLRTLPVDGPQVICGPGENAGVVDIGNGKAVIFKMESHNHPSYIEPYHGAATGVGGILRDVFTMGARPIAVMNALSFGLPNHPRTRAIVGGVVAGVGGYGNCFGVPNIGGQTRFHASYNGNCLVNAFAAGIADTDKIFYSAASGVGNPIVYLGAKTGRDGVGGATMASAEFGDDIEQKRPNVQIGDPFTEKRLMEACLELMAAGAVIAIQDMGAAGLTCSSVEMGDKGGLGVRLDLDKVPIRESAMSAYEIMLSESQERMLMVLKPEKEPIAREIFAKWDLDFAIIGEIIEEDRLIVLHRGEIKADLPLAALSGSAPEYDRSWVPSPAPTPIQEDAIQNTDPMSALKTLIASPNYCHKAWVWEQYDATVMGDTLRPPGNGAGIVRIHEENRALAFSVDVAPRYVYANPFEGGKQAVAGAYRALVAVGARPLAATDNLNFGNPENSAIMGQFVGAIKGIGAACKALDMPIVSGNVSFYNETDGSPILPTPTIGAVGLIEDLEKIPQGTAQIGDIALVLGESCGHMGASAFMAELFGDAGGDAPPIALEKERQHSAFILDNIAIMNAVSSIADGGLALAAFKMAHAGNMGVALEDDTCAKLFGEEQGRYLIACSFDAAEALIIKARASDVTLEMVGKFTRDKVSFGGYSAPFSELSALYSSAFAAMMGQ